MADHLDDLKNDLPMFFVIYAAEIVAGIFLGAFIVGVNLFEWCRGKALSSCDQILLALGISNILYPCITGLMLFIILLQITIPPLMSQITYGFCFFTAVSCSWLTAVLCLFYCLKIVHFKLDLIAQLKMKIDPIVPWLIVTVELVSVLCSIPGAMSVINFQCTNKSSSPLANCSLNETVITFNFPIILMTVVPNVFLPLLTVICTTVCIIWSLRKHTRSMRKNMGEGDSLRVHKTAVRTMLSLLLLYIVFYMAECCMMSIFSSPLSLIYFVMFILVLLFSPVQSVVLIIGNNKLFQNLKKLLLLITCKIQ
ncbi:taste receptor type 2 member 1-like [Bombina bombina]|uniref:taste receptor type 2 member 1-like n=1 Tax=Bombina bombina TaxID=8345 RepID=UPI00235A8BFC|nr:taste receptor type 2 member 1-like [Bombina bombina]